MLNADSKSILIIDDDLTIRKLLSFHLNRNNYTVHEAEGAKQGLNILNSNDVNLVLCDVAMDEMDGFTFCRKVRENEKYRLLPFVFVTAKSSLEDKSRALDAGGDDIITKPFDVNELLLKVNALLRRTEIYKIYGAKKNLKNIFEQKRKEILLVDDDVSVAKLFQFNLTKEGFDCVVASNVKEAMNYLKKRMPDIILSDIMMPQIDGYEFRRLLLEHEELKSIPFIFLTSKSSEKDILEGYDLNITDYVLKTSGPKVIVAKVSALINSLGKERDRLVSELSNAADSMRAKVVPEKFPVFEGFEIKHWHKPFQGIPGGDFIDYFFLDKDNLVIVLGDVMGKKWGAWYFAFAYAGYVRSALRGVLQTAKDFSPSEILQQVNKSVYGDSKVAEVFTTISIIILNKNTNELKYAGAGDLPLFYRNSVKNEITEIHSNGLLLGFNSEGNYEDHSITFNKDDYVLLITDGLIESRNSENIQFGIEGLHKIISENKYTENILEIMRDEILTYTSGKLEDDISFILIKKK